MFAAGVPSSVLFCVCDRASQALHAAGASRKGREQASAAYCSVLEDDSGSPHRAGALAFTVSWEILFVVD